MTIAQDIALLEALLQDEREGRQHPGTLAALQSHLQILKVAVQATLWVDTTGPHPLYCVTHLESTVAYEDQLDFLETVHDIATTGFPKDF